MITAAVRSTVQNLPGEPEPMSRLRAICNEQQNMQTDALDAKLLQLGHRHRALLKQREPLKDERERLWESATAEWMALGLSVDSNIDLWKAHMERTGYVQAEDADSEVLDAIMEVEADIRAIPAASFAGLSVKLAVLRSNLGPSFDDNQPRQDQDWHVFQFNEFADEVGRLAACVTQKHIRHEQEGGALSMLLANHAELKAEINGHEGDCDHPEVSALCERQYQNALAIIGYRPHTKVEENRKAEFLREWTEGCLFSEDEQNALIASMLPEDAA